MQCYGNSLDPRASSDMAGVWGMLRWYLTDDPSFNHGNIKSFTAQFTAGNRAAGGTSLSVQAWRNAADALHVGQCAISPRCHSEMGLLHRPFNTE